MWVRAKNCAWCRSKSIPARLSPPTLLGKYQLSTPCSSMQKSDGWGRHPLTNPSTLLKMSAPGTAEMINQEPRAKKNGPPRRNRNVRYKARWATPENCREADRAPIPTPPCWERMKVSARGIVTTAQESWKFAVGDIQDLDPILTSWQGRNQKGRHQRAARPPQVS